MASELFQLTTVTRLFGDGVRLTELLGVPEVSSIETSERPCLTALRTKAKTVLDSPRLCPPLSLSNRRWVVDPEAGRIEITFDPPHRRPDWQSPVTLQIPMIRWRESDLHHAYVPMLGVHVFATRADLVPARVANHVRLVLSGNRSDYSLQRLAQIARVDRLTTGRLTVPVTVKTPVQIAPLTDDENEREESMLEQLAEELPPLTVPRSSGSFSGEIRTPPAFEVEAELAKLVEALSGPLRRSVLLVAPPGTGKTALVRELARRRREFGFGLTAFWSTSGARLMTGPSGFGMWQERCQVLCQEAGKTRALLHLGNLKELIEVGKAKSAEESVGGFMRSWIARGEITAIAECTPEELAVVERMEPHLLSAFFRLDLPERTPEQTRAVLDGVWESSPGPRTEPNHRPATRAALDRLHLLHQRYATYSANPGRAVRFLRNLLADRFPSKALTENAVVAAFSRETGLPGVLLDDQIPLQLDETQGWFSGQVVGQDDAVERVLDLLAVIKARLARPSKPLASLLFIGPTGTGKTEMAKTLARFLFGDASRMARFDLNEFADPVSVQRLIGSPAGRDSEGLLTARMREQPFSVLLLDEFEKADPSFFDLLLQILGDGRLTDAAGRVADFCNSVIVMTSNLGSQGFQRGPSGFRATAGTSDAREHFTAAVRNFLRPEIYNRFDAVVPFQPLSPSTIRSIAQRQVDQVLNRDGLRLRPVELNVEPAVIDLLARRGFDERYGARPLKRALERDLVVPLAEALGGYEQTVPLRITLTVQREQLHIRLAPHTRPATHPSQPERARLEFVDGIVARRRRIGRLGQCPLMIALENRITMLSTRERRHLRASVSTLNRAPPSALLRRLNECRDAVQQLVARAVNLEDAAVESLHSGEPLQTDLFTDELNALTAALRRSQREVFRLQQSDPDDTVLGIYSEHRETLLFFAKAYWTLGGALGQVVSLEILTPPPAGRRSDSRLVRQTVDEPRQFFESPPAQLLGIILHLRGELFRARFQGEQGRHELKDKSAHHRGWIETAPPPSDAYEPPDGVERKGGLQNRNVDLVRVFDRNQKIATDAEHQGNVPWLSPQPDRVIEELTLERLDRTIENSTQ